MKAILKNFFFIHSLIFQKYSILRVMQILEIKKLELRGSILDVGSKKSATNISNYLNTKHPIKFADKYSQDLNDIKIDLEKEGRLQETVFDNVLLMNVLEHIFNFKNCIKNCYLLLNKDGSFYGSTPFLFRIHGSPNDYFRYTDQALILILQEAGFKNVKNRVICGGIFISFYNSISIVTNRIPFLNNILLIFFQILDLFFELFSKKNKSTYPLGYFFQATK